jgi:hypothetical protein
MDGLEFFRARVLTQEECSRVVYDGKTGGEFSSGFVLDGGADEGLYGC